MKNDLLKQAGSAMQVQQNQVMSVEEQINQVGEALEDLSHMNDLNLQNLDLLIEQANQLSEEEISIDPDIAIETEEQLEQIQNYESSQLSHISINLTDTVDYQDDWDEYVESITKYANNHHLDLRPDPYYSLMSQSQRDELVQRVQEDYYTHQPEMDKYDYMIAAFCGVFSGLIDSFFVGKPGESQLGDWTNKKTDEIIIKFSKKLGWKPKKGISVHNAISSLERKYKVNYDQATGKDTDRLLAMNTKNHHIKSLSHSPDIIGLFFSIIDQFTSQSHFVDNGHLKIYYTEQFELKGNNLVAKIFAGFCNWLGHCISDMAGSSGTRSKNPSNYGSGLSIPFFELFQFIGVGEMGEDYLTIADTAVKMFELGYDYRFGMAMSIPVFINEMSIRMIWMLKRHYYHHDPWKNCVPVVLARELKNNENNVVILRRMLLAGEGSLCLVDFGDALIRSKGVETVSYTIDVLLHMNFKAWKKFSVNLAISGVMEVRLNYNCNHIDIDKLNDDLQDEWGRMVEAI